MLELKRAIFRVFGANPGRHHASQDGQVLLWAHIENLNGVGAVFYGQDLDVEELGFKKRLSLGWHFFTGFLIFGNPRQFFLLKFEIHSVDPSHGFKGFLSLSNLTLGHEEAWRLGNETGNQRGDEAQGATEARHIDCLVKDVPEK